MNLIKWCLRGTKIRWPRSLITTSAARSSKLSDAPTAIAETVPRLQGTLSFLGAADPEATGLNRCLYHILLAVLAWRYIAHLIAHWLFSLPESLIPDSISNTTRAALEISTYT